MKKLILSLTAVLTLLLVIPVSAETKKPEVTDHEKVTIYIFWGNGCPNCTNAINYFYELGNEYNDYFEVKTYEVWYNKANNYFAAEVAGLLNHELKGVPFLVVGEKYISGWGGSVGAELIEYALDYYQDKNYKDVVKEALKDTDYEVEETSLEDAYREEATNNTNSENQKDETGGKYDTIIIVGIFAVLIGGFVALVMIGKK